MADLLKYPYQEISRESGSYNPTYLIPILEKAKKEGCKVRFNIQSERDDYGRVEKSRNVVYTK